MKEAEVWKHLQGLKASLAPLLEAYGDLPEQGAAYWKTRAMAAEARYAGLSRACQSDQDRDDQIAVILDRRGSESLLAATRRVVDKAERFEAALRWVRGEAGAKPSESVQARQYIVDRVNAALGEGPYERFAKEDP